MIHDSKVNTCDRSNELKLAFFWNIFVTKKILTRWHDSFKNDQSSLFVFFVFLLHHVTNLFRSSQKYIFIDIFYLSATWIKHNHQGGLFTWIWTWTLGLTLSKTIGKNPKLTLCAEREREREGDAYFQCTASVTKRPEPESKQSCCQGKDKPHR